MIPAKILKNAPHLAVVKGTQAFADGKSMSDCPFEAGIQRDAWIEGFGMAQYRDQHRIQDTKWVSGPDLAERRVTLVNLEVQVREGRNE